MHAGPIQRFVPEDRGRNALFLVAVSWVLVGLASLLLAIVTGRVAELAILGIAVADRRLQRASRLRLAARGLAGMLIGLAAIAAVVFLRALFGVFLPQAIALLAGLDASRPGLAGRFVAAALDAAYILTPVLALGLGISLWAWRLPHRAPQDWIARTWLMPE